MRKFAILGLAGVLSAFGMGLAEIRALQEVQFDAPLAELDAAAAQVLDHAGVFETTAEAIADCDFVFATTARGRELAKPIYTPEAAMNEARARIAAGQKVAVLFGPERTGLENEDIIRANAIITVPVNPKFFSLNLGQAVLLTAYEFSRQTVEVEAVAEGLTNKVVAARLGITERTVKAHLGAVFEKLGLRDRVQLVLQLAQVKSYAY